MKHQSDSTVFADTEEELFNEYDWKDIKEEIATGPQAISIDISFSKFDSLYGLPERINNFKI